MKGSSVQNGLVHIYEKNEHHVLVFVWKAQDGNIGIPADSSDL